MKRVAIATVILGAAALAHAQPPRENPSTSGSQTLRISGRVLAEETGEAIANARVTLAGSIQTAPVVLTDADGGFVLIAPPGRYTVASSKSGFSRREVTVTNAGQPIEIRLLRGAAISGRVVDALGDPVVAVRIVAETAVSTAAGFSVAASTDTDDRGEYRLGGLQPGTFAIAALTRGPITVQTVGTSRVMGAESPKIYYPGVTTPGDAQGLRLQAGEERPAIDFILPAGYSGGGPFMMSFSPVPGRAPAQDPTGRQTGVIRGRVVSTDGRAVPHAQVRLASQREIFQQNVVTADDDGRFEIQDLAAGSYRIAASKVGYSAPGEPVVLGPPPIFGGKPFDLADGQTIERVDITLARWSTLAGAVFDELGDPLQGVSVQLLQVRYQAGRRRLVATGRASRVTDDLGRFRAFGVAPGQYIVSATVGDVASADLPGYTRSYFPGTPNAGDAQFVSIGIAQEIVGVDFSLSRTRTALVAGTLLSSSGEPTTGGGVRLMPSQRSTSVTSVPVGARIQPDGRFEFPNVPPGQYVIQVDRGRRNSWTDGEFGTMPVSVDGANITDLILQTSSGSSIRGRVTFDTYLGTKTPQPGAIEILPVPTDPDQAPSSPATANIHQDWTFEIGGVNGPRRLQLLRAPAEWTLKEIRVNGIDATDRSIAFGRSDQSLADVEVVLTDRINELSGSITDDRTRPAPPAHLVVFSTDRDRWYPASRFLRHTMAGNTGGVTLTGLPPGSYYAAAVGQLPADGEDAWQDPAYLESLIPRASTIAFGDGQKQILNLKLAASAGR